MVGDPDDHAGPFLEPGVLDEVLGDADASGGVERLVMRAGVEAPTHDPPVAAERVEVGEDALLEASVLAGGENVDAGVEARREHHPIGKGRPEARGDRQAVLGVEVVLVLAAKRQPWGPLSRGLLNPFGRAA
jgi:hypothetical protein